MPILSPPDRFGRPSVWARDNPPGEECSSSSFTTPYTTRKWAELEARICIKRHPRSGGGGGGGSGGGVGVGIDLHNCRISAMVDLNGVVL